MTVKNIIDEYYKHANNGDWDSWIELFDEDIVLDEQLAGRVESRETLKGLMDGMSTNYSAFQNKPKQILIDGDNAAVISHISARAAKHPDEPIEAEVMNYFEIVDGKIKYMSNYHDSKPFKPFLDQLAGK